VARLSSLCPLLVSLALSAACADDGDLGSAGGEAGDGSGADAGDDDDDDAAGDDDGGGTGAGQDAGGDDDDDDDDDDDGTAGDDDDDDGTAGDDDDDTDGTAGDDDDDDDDDSSGTGDTGEPEPPAFDCDAGDGPVTVEGGGSYDTIADAVEAAPPDGVVLICPGEYEDNVVIERSVTIRGAGSDHVFVDGGAAPIFNNFNAQAPFLRFEGMTLVGGTRGIRVDWPLAADDDGDPVVEIDDLHITGTEGIGLEVVSDGYFGTVTVTETRIDHVTGGNSQSGLLVGGGAYLLRVSAELTDTVLENNIAEAGGAMFIAGADVTFTGGRVAGNTANEGGGAVLSMVGSPFVQAGRIEIIDSDWGEGAAEENEHTDVWCDGAGDDAGFLGAKTNSMCVANSGPCCL